jgi:hypothetical protein
MFKTRKLEIPKLDEALPELATERLLKVRIQAEATQLKSDIATLRASIQHGVAPDGRNERVAAILSGVEPPKSTTDMSKFEGMLRRLNDLNSAIEAQSAKIIDMERKASALICEQLRGEHDRLAADLCSKLLDVYHANAAYIALQHAMTDQSVSLTSLQPLTSRILEHPRDRYSGLSFLLKEAKQKGLIDGKSIPEAIRQ